VKLQAAIERFTMLLLWLAVLVVILGVGLIAWLIM
jgi:hypothetical protein